MALNERCASLFAPIDYSSTDIAVTPGAPVAPVVVEVDIGGASTLPQLATGQGMLTVDAADFFQIPLRRRPGDQ